MNVSCNLLQKQTIDCLTDNSVDQLMELNLQQANELFASLPTDLSLYERCHWLKKLSNKAVSYPGHLSWKDLMPFIRLFVELIDQQKNIDNWQYCKKNIELILFLENQHIEDLSLHDIKYLHLASKECYSSAFTDTCQVLAFKVCEIYFFFYQSHQYKLSNTDFLELCSYLSIAYSFALPSSYLRSSLIKCLFDFIYKKGELNNFFNQIQPLFKINQEWEQDFIRSLSEIECLDHLIDHIDCFSYFLYSIEEERSIYISYLFDHYCMQIGDYPIVWELFLHFLEENQQIKNGDKVKKHYFSCLSQLIAFTPVDKIFNFVDKLIKSFPFDADARYEILTLILDRFLSVKIMDSISYCGLCHLLNQWAPGKQSESSEYEKLKQNMHQLAFHCVQLDSIHYLFSREAKNDDIVNRLCSKMVELDQKLNQVMQLWDVDIIIETDQRQGMWITSLIYELKRIVQLYRSKKVCLRLDDIDSKILRSNLLNRSIPYQDLKNQIIVSIVFLYNTINDPQTRKQVKNLIASLYHQNYILNNFTQEWSIRIDEKTDEAKIYKPKTHNAGL